jgi:voltage-gated potassium channel
MLNLLRYGPYLLIRHIWIQLSVLAAMFFACAFVFQHYQGLDWLSALLGSVSTITTIGIYAPNISAMPGNEKIFLIIIFIVSVGAAASLVQGIVTSVLRRELFVEEMDEIKAKDLKGHVIIMGYSFLGKYVSARLRELGLTSIVIAKDEGQARLARKGGNVALDAPVTHSFDVLKQAGIQNAVAFVATYDDDGDNLLAVMAAKRLNPYIRAVTIVNENELMDEAKAAQADVVIAPSDIIGHILAVSAISKEVAGVFTSDRMRGKEIAEFEIEREGLKRADLEKICPVLLIIREGNLLSDVSKEFLIKKGDIVYTLTDHESLVAFRGFLGARKV